MFTSRLLLEKGGRSILKIMFRFTVALVLPFRMWERKLYCFFWGGELTVDRMTRFHQYRFVFFMIRRNSSWLTWLSPSLSASAIISCKIEKAKSDILCKQPGKIFD